MVIILFGVTMIGLLLTSELTRKNDGLLNSGEMIIIQITIFITHCHCLISYNNTILMKEDFSIAQLLDSQFGLTRVKCYH